jgi:hypothetical protein
VPRPTPQGPVDFDADGVVSADDTGEVTLGATWEAHVASVVLPIHPIGRAPVVFEAQLPSSTPEGATIYLSGDLPELGAWDPAAVALAPPHGGRARSAELALPIATAFEYRYGLGSEASAEASASGAPVAPRSGGPIPEEGALIVDLVRGWLAPDDP